MSSHLLTTTEVAQLFQVDPRTIQRWARERRIPHLRIGRSIRFLPTQIDEALAAYTQPAHQHRPEADIPNNRFQPYAQVVPMRRPGGAA